MKHISSLIIIFYFHSLSFSQDTYNVKSISPIYKDPILNIFSLNNFISDRTYYDSTDLKVIFINLDTIIINKYGNNWYGDTIVLKTNHVLIENETKFSIEGVSTSSNSKILVNIYKENNKVFKELEIIYSIKDEYYHGLRFSLERLNK